jgi:hypothetical protein
VRACKLYLQTRNSIRSQRTAVSTGGRTRPVAAPVISRQSTGGQARRRGAVARWCGGWAAGGGDGCILCGGGVAWCSARRANLAVRARRGRAGGGGEVRRVAPPRVAGGRSTGLGAHRTPAVGGQQGGRAGAGRCPVSRSPARRGRYLFAAGRRQYFFRVTDRPCQRGLNKARKPAPRRCYIGHSARRHGTFSAFWRRPSNRQPCRARSGADARDPRPAGAARIHV